MSFLIQSKSSSSEPTTPPESPAQLQPGPYTINLFYILATFVAAHHIYSAFSPSSINWGFHHLAFFSTPVRVVWILLVLFVLLPWTRRILLQKIESGVDRISRFPAFPVLSALTLGSAALFWIGRSRWHLSGDGALILRELNQTLNSGGLFEVFKRVRLTRILDWNLYHLFNSITTVTFEEVFWVIGVVVGVLFFLLLYFFVRELPAPPTERLLLAGLILFAGSSRLFFGYVEDYPLLYLLTFLYLILSYLFLMGRVHLLLPSAAFALMFAVHFGAVVLLPSYLFLLYHQIKKKERGTVLILVVATVASGLLLKIGGYTPANVYRVVIGRKDNLLALFTTEAPIQNYPIFSWQYLVENFNLVMLIAPYALLLGVLFILPRVRSLNWRRPLVIYLITATVCGFFFVLSTDPRPGLSLDWDVYTTFFLPAIISVVLIYHNSFQFSGKKEILFVAVFLTLLHTVPWIALNANEEKALARHRVLYDARIWGPGARTGYLEELAIYYREHEALDEALRLYQHLQTIDSTNGRIYHSIAYLNERLGQREAMMANLETSVRLGWYHREVLTALAKLCRLERDSPYFISSEKDPKVSEVFYDLGVYYFLNKAECGKALLYFEKALSLNPSLVPAYKWAIRTSLCVKDTMKARDYYEKLLDIQPNDPDLPQMSRELGQSERQ